MTQTAPAPQNTQETSSKSRDKQGLGRTTWAQWPRYNEAAEGFRNYWYPVFWSRDIKAGKPYPLRLIGEDMMLFREPTTGKVHAMRDRCPHRGVPLSDGGTQEFPGTFSCPYHGWSFNLESGRLDAVITDGPKSPLCGKVFQRVFPTEERLGLVWVYVGDGENVPPVEADIPAELVDNKNLTIGGRITVREANWRYGTENGYDEGHAKFLHRRAWLVQTLGIPLGVWNNVKTVMSEDGIWSTRVESNLEYEGEFPGVGRWPRKEPWFLRIRKNKQNLPGRDSEADQQNVDPAILALNSPGTVSVRMPCTLRVLMAPTWIHYEWCIGVDEEHYRYIQLAVQFKSDRRSALKFKAMYASLLTWMFHGQFTGQDESMVRVTSAPPERLYRPDASIIGWRNLCETARTADGIEPEEPSKVDRPRSRELRGLTRKSGV